MCGNLLTPINVQCLLMRFFKPSTFYSSLVEVEGNFKQRSRSSDEKKQPFHALNDSILDKLLLSKRQLSVCINTTNNTALCTKHLATRKHKKSQSHVKVQNIVLILFV